MDIKEAQRILGVTDETTPEDLKNQFRRLTRQWYPDKNPGVDSKIFALINTAYLVLKANALGIDKVNGVPTEVAEAQVSNRRLF